MLTSLENAEEDNGQNQTMSMVACQKTKAADRDRFCGRPGHLLGD